MLNNCNYYQNQAEVTSSSHVTLATLLDIKTKVLETFWIILGSLFFNFFYINISNLIKEYLISDLICFKLTCIYFDN